MVSGFHPNRGRDRYRDRDRLFHHRTLSWVSWFQGFGVSGFQGFRVSSGSGSLSGSGSIVSPQNTFLGFKVSGFKVSWFHRGRDRYRYRDRLFHHRTLSLVSRFLVSRFHGFKVSGFLVSWFLVSWFHRGRDRYRYRDRLFHHSLTVSPPLRLRASPASQYVSPAMLARTDRKAVPPVGGAVSPQTAAGPYCSF